jgi:CsoR family transcriptional regulator, copper-sensing transcriptional repressor
MTSKKTDILKEKSSSQIPGKMGNMARLNRISGQIEGIKKMIKNDRYCTDIICQLRAVRSAVKAVESNILQKHLKQCVAQSFSCKEDKENKIEEFKMLFDHFEE